jgi:Ran GTPase-activating protein (RanGAP) involved in mRNA processing and transport
VLKDYHGKIVQSLIHSSRFLELNDAIINKYTRKWKTNYLGKRLCTSYNVIDLDQEACFALKQDTIPRFTYKDLDTVTKKEWVNMQSKGLDLSKLEEGKVRDISYKELIFQKLCTRVEALEQKRDKEAQQQETEYTLTSTQLLQQISHLLKQIVSV